MLRNVEFVLLVIAAVFATAVTAVTAEKVDDCKSCRDINGGGEDDGEPDTDSTSEPSLLSDLYGEHKEVSTCTLNKIRKKTS